MSFKSSATLTSSGQVTIPADIREKLGVKPGDRLDFHLGSSGKLTVVAVKRRSIFDGLEELQLPSLGRPLTRQDIDDSIADEMIEQERRIRTQK